MGRVKKGRAVEYKSRKIEIKRYHSKWGQDTRGHGVMQDCWMLIFIFFPCFRNDSLKIRLLTLNWELLNQQPMIEVVHNPAYSSSNWRGTPLTFRKNFYVYELPRTMKDLRDSGRGRASMWSIRTYWRMTKRHMYCNGRTSEKRDTGFVSRTGYEGDPGERDLIITQICIDILFLKDVFEMNRYLE